MTIQRINKIRELLQTLQDGLDFDGIFGFEYIFDKIYYQLDNMEEKK